MQFCNSPWDVECLMTRLFHTQIKAKQYNSIAGNSSCCKIQNLLDSKNLKMRINAVVVWRLEMTIMLFATAANNGECIGYDFDRIAFNLVFIFP